MEKQLNYLEASTAMNNGHKVKLPEWTGYWRKTANGMIEVHTKDGDVIIEEEGTSEWYHKYKERTDWEVTEGNFGFDFAIRAMKNGKKVRRKAWPLGVYIWLLPENWIKKEWVKDELLLSVFSPDQETLLCKASIRMRNHDSTVSTGWNNIADMFENDWELVI